MSTDPREVVEHARVSLNKGLAVYCREKWSSPDPGGTKPLEASWMANHVRLALDELDDVLALLGEPQPQDDDAECATCHLRKGEHQPGYAASRCTFVASDVILVCKNCAKPVLCHNSDGVWYHDDALGSVRCDGRTRIDGKPSPRAEVAVPSFAASQASGGVPQAVKVSAQVIMDELYRRTTGDIVLDEHAARLHAFINGQPFPGLAAPAIAQGTEGETWYEKSMRPLREEAKTWPSWMVEGAREAANFQSTESTG